MNNRHHLQFVLRTMKPIGCAKLCIHVYNANLKEVIVTNIEFSILRPNHKTWLKKIANNAIYSSSTLSFTSFIGAYVLSWYYNLTGWSTPFNIIFKGASFLRGYLQCSCIYAQDIYNNIHWLVKADFMLEFHSNSKQSSTFNNSIENRVTPSHGKLKENITHCTFVCYYISLQQSLCYSNYLNDIHKKTPFKYNIWICIKHFGVLQIFFISFIPQEPFFTPWSI